MSAEAEARRLRLWDSDTDDAFTRDDAAPDGGSPAIVCTTTTKGTYPTTAKAFYWVQPLSATGTETEGSQGSVTSNGSAPFLALNLGIAIPGNGSVQLLVRWVNYRWVFRYDG